MITTSQMTVLSASARRTRIQAVEFADKQKQMLDEQIQGGPKHPFGFVFDSQRFAWFETLGETFPIRERLTVVDEKTTAMEYTIYSRMTDDGQYAPTEDAQIVCRFWMIDGHVRTGSVDNLEGAMKIDQRPLLNTLAGYIVKELMRNHFTPSAGQPIEKASSVA